MSIELQTGTECLISDASDAELYAGIEGSGNYVLRKPLELSLANTNTLIVGPGNVLQNGRHIRLKGSTDFIIPSGIQAQKRSNIAVIRTTISRDEETMETITHSEGIVLSGEPTLDGEPEDPEWIEGNLLDGDTIADMPIARVVTDGINAREPEPMYKVLSTASEFRDSILQYTERSFILGKATSLSNGVSQIFDISDMGFTEPPKVTPVLSTWCTVYMLGITATSVKISVCPFLANVSLAVTLRFEKDTR